MEKITRKKFIELLSSVEFIQYLGSSLYMQDINTMDSRIDNWDGGYISRRKIHRNSIPDNKRIVFEYTEEREDYKNGLYGHGNISYLYFKKGDEFYRHGDFLLMQSKKDNATIIYRLDI